MAKKHIELCCECDQPTGNAGRLDDSLYTDDGKGPYCHDCFDAEKAAEQRRQADIGKNLPPNFMENQE